MTENPELDRATDDIKQAIDLVATAAQRLHGIELAGGATPEVSKALADANQTAHRLAGLYSDLEHLR